MANPKGLIGIIPMGTVPKHALEVISDRIFDLLGIRAHILNRVENPSYAFDRKRGQYDAAQIMTAAESMTWHECPKTIWVLNVDLYIPIFTHVFGEARDGGSCALVSLYRLDSDAEGFPVSEEKLMARAAKVALHEIGHLFSVPHCTDYRCIMHFSTNLDVLDEIPMAFCHYCTAYLEEGVRRAGLR